MALVPVLKSASAPAALYPPSSSTIRWKDQQPDPSEVLSTTRLAALTEKAATSRNWFLTLIKDPHHPDPVIRRFKTRYVESTWSTKRRMVNMVSEAFGAPIDVFLDVAPDLLAYTFCQTLETKLKLGQIIPSTAKGYTRSFVSILPRINPSVLPSDLMMLKDFAASFTAIGADFPSTLAIPMDAATLRMLITSPLLDLDLRAAIWVP
jgi:hypothetical protein